MKILVFSDSHGNTSLMEREIDMQRPDLVIHLGDMISDARTLARKYPDLPVEAVPGNCDGFSAQAPYEKLLELAGRRILMTHGHIYQVKSGIGAAVEAAQAAQADILLFGHTHQALCDRQGSLWILNPGTIRGGFQATCGVISLEPEGPMCYTASVG